MQKGNQVPSAEASFRPRRHEDRLQGHAHLLRSSPRAHRTLLRSNSMPVSPTHRWKDPSAFSRFSQMIPNFEGKPAIMREPPNVNHVLVSTLWRMLTEYEPLLPSLQHPECAVSDAVIKTQMRSSRCGRSFRSMPMSGMPNTCSGKYTSTPLSSRR